MTVDDIYSKIEHHMIKGLMVHEQLSNYYDFLGLSGYRRCHEYHYFKENLAYRKMARYFTSHYNKLINIGKVEDPHIIPDSWYNYTRDDVDTNTKKSAVKSGLQVWREWETETKELFEQMYAELIANNEVAGALHLVEYIEDVDEELKEVTGYCLNKKAIEYDLKEIISEQKKYHRKYKKLMK